MGQYYIKKQFKLKKHNTSEGRCSLGVKKLLM